MTLSLAVVCEAAADQHTGCDLADRVVCAGVAWIEEEHLPHLRAWRGFTPADRFLPWTQVDDLARARRIKAHGHFDGRPGAPDAHVARLALLLFIAADPRPDAVVLLRDDDRQTARRTGLEQARSTSKLGVPIVIGLAHPKRECWVLADCWTKTDLQRLAVRGQNTGLAGYLDEVRTRLVPLFPGHSEPP